jgi:PTS system nitrogen regulatory IIA component
VALPHFSTRVSLGRDAGVIALVLLRGALPMAEPAVDGVPVTRLFFFVPPSPRAHLDTLGKLSRAISKGPLRTLLERDAPDDDIYRALAVVDAAGGGEGKRGTPV